MNWSNGMIGKRVRKTVYMPAKQSPSEVSVEGKVLAIDLCTRDTYAEWRCLVVLDTNDIVEWIIQGGTTFRIVDDEPVNSVSVVKLAAIREIVDRLAPENFPGFGNFSQAIENIRKILERKDA